MIISQLVYRCRSIFGNAREDSILRWPLSFMWEIHWRWFGRLGWMTCKKTPTLQVAPTDFWEACKLTWRELAFYVAATWRPWSKNMRENFVPLFFRALNSVGQQQHSTIWGWDADPAVLFRWWLRIAVCLLFFLWLAQNHGRKRWTSLTRICNTYKYSTCRIPKATYIRTIKRSRYQRFCATLLWDLGHQSLNTYPHQLYMYRAHLYRVTDVNYFQVR